MGTHCSDRILRLFRQTFAPCFCFDDVLLRKKTLKVGIFSSISGKGVKQYFAVSCSFKIQ